VTTPIYIATERFDSTDGEKWGKYFEWAKIPNLTEIIGLDSTLCPRLPQETSDEDWAHVVNEEFRTDYFLHLDYLIKRIQTQPRRNILGLYRNPNVHVSESPASGDFIFMGYDLIEEQTQISALTNCGGFPDVFSNGELNNCGLILDFNRAAEVKQLLAEKHPEEPHAQCEMYSVWLLNEELSNPRPSVVNSPA
jgi:hypothetical protein